MRQKFMNRMPNSRAGRTVVGVLLIIFGILGFLPIVGFWMIPLGFVVLSYDSPKIRRWRRRVEVRLGRWWAKRKQGKQQRVSMRSDLAISIVDIKAAASRIKGVAVRTEMITNSRLDGITGGRVFIKSETGQHTGSFKFRGAWNRLSQLSDAERAVGVVAFSSGNHAQGVASAAKQLGVPATIVMPLDAPSVKMDNTKALGATVVTYDRYKESREAIAQRLCEESGAVLVPSFEDRHIMAGQGTIGLEVADDLAAIDIVPDYMLICCGGGGLASGCTVAMRDRFTDIGIRTVEPAHYDDVARSLVSGSREKADFSKTSICDAILTEKVGVMPFEILRHHSARGLVVSDEDVKVAVRFAHTELGISAEPGGSVGLAAVLSKKIDLTGKTAVVVISGGNIDPAMKAQILAGQ